ncbi:MAG: hypothetical protein H6716_29185 [Polyangiaceae bacterium]|nr:hypothetical protein [Polyangiaceae bacterium]
MTWDDDQDPSTPCSDVSPSVSCSAGYEVASPTVLADWTCRLCEAGSTWDHDADYSTPCVASTPASTLFCSVGTKVTASTPTVDTSCVACDVGDTALDGPGCAPLRRLSAGYRHACAIDRSDAVRCWGDNNYGQTDVPIGLSNAVGVAVGQYHSCAVDSAGDVTCWGSNASGQRDVPAWLEGVVEVAAGGSNTCALDQWGDVTCWGSSSSVRAVPATVHSAVRVSVSGTHACVITASQGVECWGGQNANSLDIPDGLVDVVAISTGQFMTCALVYDGMATCWGYLSFGYGVVTRRASMGALISLELPIESSPTSAAGSPCGLSELGKVECWDGYSANYLPTDLTRSTVVSAGNGFACAGLESGVVRCWGYSPASGANVLAVPSDLRL